MQAQVLWAKNKMLWDDGKTERAKLEKEARVETKVDAVEVRIITAEEVAELEQDRLDSE